MKVLVTGVGGFVGQHLARCLHESGDDVVGSYWPEPVEVPGVELHPADVCDREAVERIVRKVQPDAVVHLAGMSHVGESWDQPGCYFRVNVEGTENVVRAAAGARVLIASSSEVYGAVPEPEQPIREDRRLDPGSPYGLTKAAAERIAFALGGSSVIAVRSFNLIGPGQAPRFALPSFAGQLAAIARGDAEPVISVGNLSARRDFVHVAAAARGYERLLRDGTGGSVYNLASGHAWSIEEALAALVRISGVEARVEVDPKRVRPVDQPLLEGEPSRLAALGWAPEPGVEQAIEELWREAAGAP